MLLLASQHNGRQLANVLLLSALLSPSLWAADSCKPLTKQLLERVSESIATRFDLAPDLVIEDQGAGKSCYRQLIVRARSPRRTFVFYLSPNQQFISPDLIDLSLSHTEELVRERDKVMDDLLSTSSPTKGPASAAMTLVELSDFQCPFCKIINGYISRAWADGFKFKVVFKQMPLPQHSWAKSAAVYSACVAKQNSDVFWILSDYLFTNQAALTPASLDGRITELLTSQKNINMAQVKACVSNLQPDSVFADDAALGRRYHINQIPTVFLNGVRKDGFTSYDEFVSAVRAAIAPTTDAPFSSLRN